MTKGKIVVIDDKMCDAIKIKNEVQKFLKDDEILVFHEFNKDFLINNKIDLLVLDVELEKSNGIKELEELQKEQSHKMNVIIVSHHDDFIFDSFLVKPVCFCRKHCLEQDMKRAFNNLDATHFRKEIEVDGTNIRVNDIMYLESKRNTIIFHLNHYETIAVRNKLSFYEVLLDQYHFVRCHQSYLVNCEYVIYHKGKAILKNGVTLPISRKYSKKINQKFLQYIIDTS